MTTTRGTAAAVLSGRRGQALRGQRRPGRWAGFRGKQGDVEPEWVPLTTWSFLLGVRGRARAGLDGSMGLASVFLHLSTGCPGGMGSKLFLAGARRASDTASGDTERTSQW
ncbi:unnamed protein product [Rangifer tarandus platyrhynchus]|uniref:Uncharacterized protein n=1 Tax=Rangifer tarandus platyrhynchus TaxID=3082113 RepID=A0ABN9A1X5_RANTA|nr:unnamed protein product [Rangifer tarandus platyrhynchus]